MRQVNLIGQKFGFLTVVSEAESPRRKKRAWKCICSACGNAKTLTTGELRWREKRQSAMGCGCLRGRSPNSGSKTHGMSRSRPYRIYCGMINRCCVPSTKDYARYGARGITVCARWRESFESFWADMAEGYADNLTLDRKDNSGPYSPENCRWASAEKQANNRRSTVLFQGKPIAEWARKLGISRSTILNRIRQGCPEPLVLHKGKLRKRFSTLRTAAPATGSSSSERKAR